MLAAAGFSMDEVNYGMTLRERNILLLAISRRELQQQQAMTQSVALAIGSIFTKDGGKKIADAVKASDAKLESMMAEILDVSEKQLHQEHEKIHAERRKLSKKAPSEMDMRKVIGKLDRMMSKLTGKMVSNPLAVHDVE